MNTEVIKQLHTLLPGWWAPHGASKDKLLALASEVGINLPADYVEFMQLVDGYSGDVGNSGYVDIMTVDEAIAANSAHKIKETMHGLVLFGSDGAGEAFAFDVRNGGSSVVQVPWVGMDWETAIPIGVSLLEFLVKLGQGVS